jgi:hypothetical protein
MCWDALWATFSQTHLVTQRLTVIVSLQTLKIINAISDAKLDPGCPLANRF